MSAVRIGGALQERLGEPASAELIEILDGQRAATEAVVRETAERFERRLVEETSTLRLEMVAMRGDLRTEMGAVRSELKEEIGAVRSQLKEEIGAVRSELKEEIGATRSELKGETSSVRSDLRAEIAELRCELREGFANVRRDMAAGRFELLKWAFLFWVGQLASITAIVGLLLRTMPAR